MACSCVDCPTACPLMELDIGSSDTFMFGHFNAYGVVAAVLVLVVMIVASAGYCISKKYRSTKGTNDRRSWNDTKISANSLLETIVPVRYSLSTYFSASRFLHDTNKRDERQQKLQTEFPKLLRRALRCVGERWLLAFSADDINFDNAIFIKMQMQSKSRFKAALIFPITLMLKNSISVVNIIKC